MPRPLIALSTSELHEPHHTRQVQQTLTHRRDLALGMDYPHTIAQAGGVPVVVPPSEAVDIDALAERVDGLCLSGGPDIDPSVYGAQPHPALGPTDPEVDRFEVALLRAAQARDLPILCLCRGMQTLNVARGGTLIQDLPSQRPSSVSHRQEGSGTQPTHRVRIEAGSVLATALQAVEVEVNTFHHQAVDRLGEGLRPVAWTPDDLIEGIEDPDQRFLVGVQWHAESLRALAEQRALFAAFTAAAVHRPSMVS
ncbi:MAG: gamma-glutamyl-gamma-aminobutyrate hydrolase family protein [Solirubrobacteraceae bacterium MAG38_C4-C5]|nr:gamma-glutamyl-gamma-aminobutyrate hydrolase family protein [Candidatus Siliceabacter maunaloa]